MNKNGIPISGTFELTGRCNLSCAMCFVRVDKNQMKNLNKQEKSSKEWIRMAEQAKKAGTLSLLLTGGEPMIRDDFCEIYEEISQMGFLLTLYTNATRVSEKVMEVLKRNPPHRIGVTIYGSTNETYHALCGCKTGFDQVKAGLDQLKELPSKLELRTTIVKKNKEDYNEICNFGKQYLEKNQNVIVSRFVMNGIRGSVTDLKKERLSPVENIKLIYPGLVSLYEAYQAGEISLKEGKKLSLNSTKMGKTSYARCDAGCREYTIAWDGMMYGCSLFDTMGVNPFDEGFEIAWTKLREQQKYIWENSNIEICDGCLYQNFCETCPAMRYGETGRWNGIPGYACREAKYLYDMAHELQMI